ncbi:hypothetical protein Tco_1193794 [Tanacetum coccineum]
MGLWYLKDSGFELIAYSDTDHAGSKDDCKSTSGGLQFLGEKLVNWSLKKQDCTAMSTAEAEYVSFFACCAQVIWMGTQLLDYGYKYNKIPMYCDSKSAIAISCNLVQHSKTKHIDIRYHFITEHVEKGTVEIYFVRTEYQLADLFTKALPKERFEYLVHRIVIIMAQPQRQADVHQDELCPPNKRYALMDANKKFWHTLKEDGSKYRLMFTLDRKELTLTLDDFRTMFHLPQANDNGHDYFVPPPKFSKMPWQTLCKMFSKCLTTRGTGWDQPPLQIMQMMYCFINNIHVDYAELLWEGIHYSLEHPATFIPYQMFIKIIVSHYMTTFTDISRRARDRYHNLEDDETMKNIFNSGRHKDKIGMQIPSWMITDEMKLTENYQMYAENVELVKEHLAAEEIKKLVEGTENVKEDSSIPKNDDDLPDTRLEPRSDKESPKVEITAEVQPVNVNEEEVEIEDDVYELKRRDKGKHVEESRSTPSPSPIRSPRIHTILISLDIKKL